MVLHTQFGHVLEELSLVAGRVRTKYDSVPNLAALFVPNQRSTGSGRKKEGAGREGARAGAWGWHLLSVQELGKDIAAGGLRMRKEADYSFCAQEAEVKGRAT